MAELAGPSATIPDRRIALALVAMVPVAWLVSDHRFPWLSAWSDAWAFYLVAAAALVIPRGARPRPEWLVALSVVLGSVMVQLWMGVLAYAGDAWMVGLYATSFCVALAVGGALGTDGPVSRAQAQAWLMVGLAACAIASTAIAFLQWTGQNHLLGLWGVPFPPNARPFGNVAQPNHLCTIAFLGLASVVGLFEQRRLGLVATVLLATLLVAGMVLSGSRTGWLQLLIGAALWVLVRRRVPTRTTLIAVVAVVVGFVVASLGLPFLNEAVQLTGSRSLADQAQPGPRTLAWRIFAAAILERPLAGWGWHQVAAAQAAVALDHAPLQYHFEHAHNLLLDLALWMGLPAALLLASVLTWALLGRWRHWESTADAALLVGVAGVLVHGMLEFPLEYAYFLLPVGLMLGLQPKGSRASRYPSPWPLRIVGGLLLSGMVLLSIDYLQAEQNHRTLRFESARIGTTRVDSLPPDLRILDQLEAFLTFARTPPRSGLSAEQVDFSRRVTERFAYPPSQFRHAQVLALNGDPEGSAHLLRVLCAMHPRPRCQEAIDGWTALQAQHPEFRAVPAPTLPR